MMRTQESCTLYTLLCVLVCKTNPSNDDKKVKECSFSVAHRVIFVFFYRRLHRFSLVMPNFLIFHFISPALVFLWKTHISTHILCDVKIKFYIFVIFILFQKPHRHPNVGSLNNKKKTIHKVKGEKVGTIEHNSHTSHFTVFPSILFTLGTRQTKKPEKSINLMPSSGAKKKHDIYTLLV